MDVRLGAQLATPRSQLAALTLLAIAAAWFWALPSMITPLLYLCPHDWTDADLVRHLWHFRLVQPEWVGTPPQWDYLRWAQAETLARLSFVLLGWIGGTAWISRRRFCRGILPRPTPPALVGGGSCPCFMLDALGPPSLSRFGGGENMLLRPSLLMLLLSTLLSAGVAAQENSSQPETREQVHRTFVSWLNGTIQAAKKGQLPQPEAKPPEAGRIFIDGAGWTRLDVLEYCLTLKPVAIEHNGTTVRLTMSAEKRPQEITGHYDAAWDANRWVAEMVHEGQKWRVVALRPLVGKPTSQPTASAKDAERHC